MLDVADFGRNPHADEFGEYGVLYVRHGKAVKGSPRKRRSVLTVWDWAPEILAEWIGEIRSLLAIEGNPALWPLERAPRVGLAQINARLSAYRDALGPDAGLDFHSLRCSYVTHLIEAGWDPLFVQLLLSRLEAIHDVQHGPDPGRVLRGGGGYLPPHGDHREVRCWYSGWCCPARWWSRGRCSARVVRSSRSSGTWPT
jgi:hypothetical protein